MAEVIVFPGETTLDLPLQRVLDGAAAAELQPALVAGKDCDGDFYLAATTNDHGALLILLERAKAMLLRHLEDLE